MTVKRNNALIFIFITVLVDVIGFGLIIPVIPKLIQELTGKGLSEASQWGGLLLFSFAGMQFLFAPIMGGLSDRYGRRPVLLLALLGLGLDYVFHAFAPTIGWLFVGRLIAGVFGASFTTATAYIADISTPEKRAQNFGLVGVAFGMGFIVGPALGALTSGWGVRAPFMVAAGLSLLNAIYGYFVLPESLLPENRRRFDWGRANPIGTLVQLKRYPMVSGMIASLVFIYIAAHAIQSNWSFFTMKMFNWNEKEVGYSLAFVGFLIALVQGGLIRLIMPKLGQKWSVYVGLMLYSLGFLLFAFAKTGTMMLIFLIPYCLGGIAGPALQGIISNQVPRNEQGELQGGLTSLMSATSIIGPLIMTNLFALFSKDDAPVYFPGAPFVLAAVMCVISVLLAMRSLSRFSHEISGKK